VLNLWRNPETTLAALSAEMDRLMNDVAAPARSWTGLAPAADIVETEADYRVVLDLPGHDPAAIGLQVEKDTLTVQADRKQPAAAAGETVHRSERSFGTFFRSFTLPKGVDAGRVEAKYEHGVLTVILPKREEAKPRTIAVQAK
jgi:HSP20 family protein